mgnify:CR=1 FL=1
MDYFCADIETSGQAPGLHSLLSIGITHVRRFEGRYRLFEDFYLELRPAFDRYSEAAMAIHGLDAERLKREGLFDLNRQLVPPWDYTAVLVLAPEGAAGLGDFEQYVGYYAA